MMGSQKLTPGNSKIRLGQKVSSNEISAPSAQLLYIIVLPISKMMMMRMENDRMSE